MDPWVYWRDVDSIGDSAGYAPVEVEDVSWSTHCKRCGVPLMERVYFCEECVADFWSRAESYSSNRVEQDRIVTDLRRRFINGTA